ncbi:MAG: hypothetical protein M3Y13_15375 [Armatimonadota bacterium]|nr:hypothetical protein [Armatimonadota bacterium]
MKTTSNAIEILNGLVDDDCGEASLFWTFRPSNAEQLRRDIYAAFADAVYPGDDNITISGCPCGECSETRAFFAGKHWREVAATGQPFHLGWGGLAILSPEAWRFYLPAYMILSLKGDGDPGETLECALYQLSPDPAETPSDFFTERTRAFTAAQRECLAAYTCAAVDAGAEDAAFEAAAAYWKGQAAGTKAEQGAV